MAKVVTMNVVVSSTHIETDVDFESFMDDFEKFLRERDLMFGGGVDCEEDDEE